MIGNCDKCKQDKEVSDAPLYDGSRPVLCAECYEEISQDMLTGITMLFDHNMSAMRVFSFFIRIGMCVLLYYLLFGCERNVSTIPVSLCLLIMWLIFEFFYHMQRENTKSIFDIGMALFLQHDINMELSSRCHEHDQSEEVSNE